MGPSDPFSPHLVDPPQIRGRISPANLIHPTPPILTSFRSAPHLTPSLLAAASLSRARSPPSLAKWPWPSRHQAAAAVVGGGCRPWPRPLPSLADFLDSSLLPIQPSLAHRPDSGTPHPPHSLKHGSVSWFKGVIDPWGKYGKTGGQDI